MIRTHHEGLLTDGIAVPLARLCAWFGVPRRTVYYKPTKAAPKVDPRVAEPIKAMIQREPSFGYRTVAWPLGLQQEHGAAHLPDQRLAGSQAADWHAATHRGRAICRHRAQRALVDGPLSHLVGSRWLNDPRSGDRLPHP